ncbi:MAG: hypothetical protein GC160_30125 [Acidobacteria bacterium]|nr:hypothetical protein [Acidobacteriota bacterium]
MPAARTLLLAVTLLCWACGSGAPPAAEAPAPSPAAEKAAEARARLEASEGGRLVLAAIEAHGGLETWYAAPTSSACWEYSNPGAEMRFRSCMTVDNQTRRAYHDLEALGTPDDPQPYEGSFAWDGEQAWIFPADTPKVNPRFWALTGFYFSQIPFVLADPGVSYEKLPDEELDGKTYSMVKCTFGSGVGDAPGDHYILYIDPADQMVRAIRYTVTFGRGARPAGKKAAGPPRETLFYYEDYATADGLKTPQHFNGFWFDDGKQGEFKNEAWATNISYSQPFDESKLAMPEGGRVQPMPGE